MGEALMDEALMCLTGEQAEELFMGFGENYLLCLLPWT